MAGVAAILAAVGCGGRAKPPQQNGPIAARAAGGVAVVSPDGKRKRLIHAQVAGWLQWASPRSRIGNEHGIVHGRHFGVVQVLGAGDGRRLVLSQALYAAWSPDGRTVAFARDVCPSDDCGTPAGGSSIELFTARFDGRHLRRLTRNGSYDGEPDWSPDGKRLVYATDDGLRIMNADGSHVRPLTLGAYHQQPRWSPDGRRVVFDSALDVFVVDVKTRRVRKLAANPGPDRDAAWSPDGRFIVYLSEHVCRICFSAEDPLELWVMRADGTRAHRLVRGRGYTEPDWAPR